MWLCVPSGGLWAVPGGLRPMVVSQTHTGACSCTKPMVELPAQVCSRVAGLACLLSGLWSVFLRSHPHRYAGSMVALLTQGANVSRTCPGLAGCARNDCLSKHVGNVPRVAHVLAMRGVPGFLWSVFLRRISMVALFTQSRKPVPGSARFSTGFSTGRGTPRVQPFSLTDRDLDVNSSVLEVVHRFVHRLVPRLYTGFSTGQHPIGRVT